MKETMLKPGWIVWRSRRLRLSGHIDGRAPLILLVLTAVTLAGLILNIGTGEYPIPPSDVVRTILGLPTANPDYDFVVNTLRVPRVLAAFLVGVMLALSGSIMQAITRNTLASPELTGVTSGAGLVAVTLIIAVPAFPMVWLPLAAFVGGMGAATFIYLLAWRSHDSPLRLILIGIGLMSITAAVTNIMITFGQIWRVQAALMWLTGSVYGRTWEDVHAVLPWLLVLLSPALLMTRELNTLALGDEVASSLGSAVIRSRLFLLITSAALAGMSVTLAGTLSFVGLIAPHMGRRLVGPAHEGLQPVTALIGGAMVVLADLVGRTILAPAEIPCGIIVSIVGAPFFLWLLYQHRKR